MKGSETPYESSNSGHFALPCTPLCTMGALFMYNTETVLVFRTALRSWTIQAQWNIFKSSGDKVVG